MTGSLRLALVATLLAAFALRVVALDALPPGLHSDEAVDGLDALSEVIAPFYPANNGREGLFVLLLAPSLAVLGREPMALRLPMALCGVLTVAAAFALGRRLSGASDLSCRVAAAGASLLSVSLFPNRFGARVSLPPLAVSIAAFFFWRAYEQRGWRKWPAPAWRPGERHRTYHLIELPTGAVALEAWLVVYDAATGAPVAPPLDLGPLR